MRKILPLLIVFIILFSFAEAWSMPGLNKDAIKEARKYAEENLLPQEGIVGISHTEEIPKIIVYTEHEKYKDKIPNEIKGFKTEVIVTGKIKALSLLEEPLYTYTYTKKIRRTGRVRPLSGGISIGVPEENFGGKMAGTLGVVVLGSEGYYYILSCAHVLAMDKNAEFLPTSTPTLQPGTYDGGTINDKVGELHKYIEITFGPKGNNYADAAISVLTVDSTDYLPYEVLGKDNKNTYKISGTYDVSVGETVRKSGRTSGVTKNIVTDTSATVKVYYTSSMYAIFYDQILVKQPFLKSGDSGSLVDKDGKFVGLGFAGSNTIAVICKAKYIITGLGITI